MTIASRSGVKTSVADSLRSCSAARSRAPFTSARFPSAGRQRRPPICTCVCPRTPSSRIRADCLAEADQLRVGARARREPLRADVQRLEQVRLAGAVRAHGENEPGLERQLQTRVRPEVREEYRGDDQPARRIGMIRYQKSSSGALQQSGPERVDQAKAELVALGGLDPVAQEVRVEPDLERLALEANRQRLAGLADVLRLRPDGHLALGEAQPQRRVAVRHHRRAADDVEQLLARRS